MTAIGSVVLLPPGAGTHFQLGSDWFRVKQASSEGPEQFSVVEYQGAPGVPGPPPHIHRSFEEAWFILEGEVTFFSGKEQARAGPGSYIFVKRGASHTFRVEGSTPARWIGIFSPGRNVRLIEELSSVFPAHGPPDPSAIGRVFAKYDTEIDSDAV